MSFLFSSNSRRTSCGLTVLRIVTGVVFTIHGYQKLFVMGFSGVSGAFAHMGAPMPGISGPLFGVAEFFLRNALIFGLPTRPGTVLFILDMVGAIAIVHIKNGWFKPGGMEFPVLLLAASIALFLAGPGAFALDNILARRGTNTS